MAESEEQDESEEEITVQVKGKTVSITPPSPAIFLPCPKSKKKKKKKKNSASVTPAEPDRIARSTTQSTNKANRNATGKAGKNKSGKDEIDLALEELAEKFPHLRVSGKSAQSASEEVANATSQALFSLLGASLKDFDSDAEMRRFFGSKVVSVCA